MYAQIRGYAIPLLAVVLTVVLAADAVFGADVGDAVGGARDTNNGELLSTFEISGGQTTPRYAETVAFCRRLADVVPWLHATAFGVSPQGRALPLLIADRHGRFTPGTVRKDSTQVVLLVEACIHAGESCGKDAGLLLLRDLVTGVLDRSLLDHVTVLFVPIFNVDGHERFGPYNRINQNGPEQMGWRVNARNLNLNRDFLKADTPEMQAWLRLFRAWLPDFFIDVHSTDGADFQYATTYGLATRGNLDAGLTAWSQQYINAVDSELAAAGYPLAPYVGFRTRHQPATGLTTWVAPPRFSHGYTAVQNRPGLLIEAHMLKDYRTRVLSTYEMLRSTLVHLNRKHAELRRLVAAADRAAASAEFRAEPFALRYERTDNSVPYDYLGYGYEVVDSELSGGQWVRFSDQPEAFATRLYDQHRPSLSVRLPAAYIVPPEWTTVLERLELHGVEIHWLGEQRELAIRTYRFRDVTWQERPYEGRHPVRFTAETMTERRVFPAGSAVVSMNQRTARLIAHALEPQGPDSFVQWGFFDPIFSRVEYVEDYVIETMMREMIAENPALVDSLAVRKADDPEFAENPWAIRYWFYEQTPYYDQRVGIYPVGLIDDGAVVETLPLGR